MTDRQPDPWASIEAELLKSIGHPYVLVADLPPETFVARFCAARAADAAQHAAKIADYERQIDCMHVEMANADAEITRLHAAIALIFDAFDATVLGLPTSTTSK